MHPLCVERRRKIAHDIQRRPAHVEQAIHTEDHRDTDRWHPRHAEYGHQGWQGASSASTALAPESVRPTTRAMVTAQRASVGTRFMAQQKRIEEQWEGGDRLPAVLRAEAEQDHATATDWGFH